jgi:putative hydrolase of the HAD superfamily
VPRTQPLRAVFLDVGGTLIESQPAPAYVYAQVLSKHGPPLLGEDVEPVFRAVWTEMTEAQPRGLDRYHLVKGGERAWWGEFVRRVMERLQHPAPWHEVLEELFAAFASPRLWHVFPEVREVLASLRRRGLRLAVISNWDSRLPGLLDSLGLREYFDDVLVSALEGVEKPAPAIFERATGRLGVQPSESLHVGDSPLDDYRGAESAGLCALLVDRAGIFGNGYDRVADLRGVHEFLD